MGKWGIGELECLSWICEESFGKKSSVLTKSHGRKDAWVLSVGYPGRERPSCHGHFTRLNRDCVGFEIHCRLKI